ARMGARTVLIHDRPVLGGNGSEELGVGIAGAAMHHPHAREGGILEEAARITASLGDHGVSKAFRLMTGEQQNLEVVDNHRVVGAEKNADGTVGAVKAVGTLTGEYGLWRGRYFIDCTGDGWLGFYAGARWRMGRESREEFGESLAPEKADGITMSGCLMDHYTLAYLAEDTGAPVSYTAPAWATRMPDPEDFLQRPISRVKTGEWWIEAPGDLDDLNDAEHARDELVRITFGFWDYVKNRWPGREAAANYALKSTSFQDARRETRRLEGDYWFKQQDAQNAVVFPDRISYGGWPLDVHHPRGILSGREGPFTCNALVPIHSLPFRILYSVNVDNLRMAGRDVSATHIGLGTVRVQGTLSGLGQAAGTAAALCLELGVTPRELGQKHIGRLQQTLLRDDQYIPALRNEDPADLARASRISASSTAPGTLFGRSEAEAYNGYELTHWRAVMFPRGSNREIKSIALALESRRREPVRVTLHLRAAGAKGDYSAGEDLAAVAATLPARHKGFVEFPIGRAIDTPFVWVCLAPAPGVWWDLMHTAPEGSSRAYRSSGAGQAWEVRDGQFHAFAVEPPLVVVGDYRPENVVNGVTRVVGDAANQWASDPAQPLPQWVELALPAPAALNTVCLTFDSDFNRRYPGGEVVRQMVRDYTLEAHDGTAWREVARVHGNYQRRRVHRFESVTAARLRLTVQATCGDRSAKVFEIRAYNEPARA
ncbi:MAG: FAD-dependent oxidoreductase, partial [bacterium]|nr:FAD-dependent oxidoreductase [bacterium]